MATRSLYQPTFWFLCLGFTLQSFVSLSNATPVANGPDHPGITVSLKAPSPAKPTSQPILRPSLSSAVRLAEAGRYREAEQQLRSMLQANPDFLEARDYLLELAIIQQNFAAIVTESAERLYANPMARPAQMPSARVDSALRQAQAKLYARQEQLAAQKIAQVRQQLQQTPQALQPRLQLIVLLRDSQDHNQQQAAVNEARRLVRANPQDGRSYQVLGSLLVLQGEFSEAIATFQTAYRLAPRDEAVLLNGAIALQAAQRHQDAIQLYQAILKQHPRSSLTYQALATAYDRTHRPQQALAALYRAWQIQPETGLLPLLGMLRQVPNQRILAEIEAYTRKHPKSPFVERALAQIPNR